MLTLFRYNLTKSATQGILLLGEQYLADTLELPWIENAKFVSCIPEGLYKLQWNQEGRKWPCYEVHDVPEREAILMHPANYTGQLEGCIAPGQKYADALWNSTIALNRIHEAAGDSVDLLITKKFGG